MKKDFYHKMVPADDKFKDAFEGWKILEVGMTNTADKVYSGEVHKNQTIEGGLTFILEKDGMKKRLILGYTELGEWIEFEGYI